MGLLPFEEVRRELIKKKEAETSLKYGGNPSERSAEELINSGIIIIDKPSGPSSHQVSAYVKQILGLQKTGHSGTLDPKVTGVLPVALGKGTRIVQSLLGSGKEYIALMYLHEPVEEGKIRNTINNFIGRIKQLPPIKSAVKRQVRERNIYYIEIIEIKDKFVLFRVGCQGGTYIRKLIHDIGIELKVNAQMVELRRTKAGPFNENEAVTLQELRDAFFFMKNERNNDHIKKIIKPIESGIIHLPKIIVLDTTIDSLCHGAQLKIPGIAQYETGIEKNDNVAVMSLKGELIATGIAKMSSEEIQNNDRGIAIILSQVFMQVGVYPKIER